MRAWRVSLTTSYQVSHQKVCACHVIRTEISNSAISNPYITIALYTVTWSFLPFLRPTSSAKYCPTSPPPATAMVLRFPSHPVLLFLQSNLPTIFIGHIIRKYFCLLKIIVCCIETWRNVHVYYKTIGLRLWSVLLLKNILILLSDSNTTRVINCAKLKLRCKVKKLS